MTALDLLAALHALGQASLARDGGKLLLPPDLPREHLDALRPFKPALLRALEDGEEVAASWLLASPYRLAALLAHALGVEASVVLIIYARGEAEPRRYLAPAANLTPHLAWASRSLPPPRRLHLAPTTGDWALDVREGWEAVLEASHPRPHVLAGPEVAARDFLAAIREGTGYRGEVRVWRPGEEALTTPLEEALLGALAPF